MQDTSKGTPRELYCEQTVNHSLNPLQRSNHMHSELMHDQQFTIQLSRLCNGTDKPGYKQTNSSRANTKQVNTIGNRSMT